METFVLISGHMHSGWDKSLPPCYYFRAESNRSVILLSVAAAILSSCQSVGDVFPFSMLFSVVLLIPVSASSCRSVRSARILACHVKTSM